MIIERNQSSHEQTKPGRLLMENGSTLHHQRRVYVIIIGTNQCSHEQTEPGRSLMEKNGSTLHHQSENKWQEEPLFRDPTHRANVRC